MPSIDDVVNAINESNYSSIALIGFVNKSTDHILKHLPESYVSRLSRILRSDKYFVGGDIAYLLFRKSPLEVREQLVKVSDKLKDLPVNLIFLVMGTQNKTNLKQTLEFNRALMTSKYLLIPIQYPEN